MPQIGPAEILVILLVGLLVFGPKRLPEIGRQVGRAMREVRKFQDTVKGELDDVLHFHDDDDAQPATNDQTSLAAAAAPPALPPASNEPGLPVTAQPPSHAPSRFRTPPPSAAPIPTVPTSSTPSGSSTSSTPTSVPASSVPASVGSNRPPSRAPLRFRAPGPRPTA